MGMRFRPCIPHPPRPSCGPGSGCPPADATPACLPFATSMPPLRCHLGTSCSAPGLGTASSSARPCRFDGEAMLHAVCFEGGKAKSYTNHWLRCYRFCTERAAGCNLTLRVRAATPPAPPPAQLQSTAARLAAVRLAAAAGKPARPARRNHEPQSRLHTAAPVTLAEAAPYSSPWPLHVPARKHCTFSDVAQGNRQSCAPVLRQHWHRDASDKTQQ